MSFEYEKMCKNCKCYPCKLTDHEIVLIATHKKPIIHEITSVSIKREYPNTNPYPTKYITTIACSCGKECEDLKWIKDYTSRFTINRTCMEVSKY